MSLQRPGVINNTNSLHAIDVAAIMPWINHRWINSHKIIWMMRVAINFGMYSLIKITLYMYGNNTNQVLLWTYREIENQIPVFFCYQPVCPIVFVTWMHKTSPKVTIRLALSSFHFDRPSPQTYSTNLQMTNKKSFLAVEVTQINSSLKYWATNDNQIPLAWLLISVCPIVFVIWVHRTSPKVTTHLALSYFQCKSPKGQTQTG